MQVVAQIPSQITAGMIILGVAGVAAAILIAVLFANNSQRDYDSDFVDHELW